MIKAALIDMDGTLYDSMPSHTEAWRRMMAEQGVNLPREEFFLYEGMTGAATIDLIFKRELGRTASPEEVKELYSIKTRYFQEIDSGKIMPGAREMLRRLKENGVERILVTGSGQRSLIDKIMSDFPGMFKADKMITASSVTRGKPHPEPYLKGMELAGAAPGECIVIENAPLGVKSGAASGAFTVGVLTGPIPPEEMIKAGADRLYPSMQAFADELPALLNELNSRDNCCKK